MKNMELSKTNEEMKMENRGKVFEDFGLSVFDAEQADILEAYADMTIGELIDVSDTLQDIPVCKTFVSVVNGVGTIRDAFLVQKFLNFSKKFREGTASEQAIEKRRDAVKKNKKWIRREIELILIRIDNISEKRNVELLCGVYLAFLNEECTWELFEEIALILERFIYHDKEQLKEIYENYIRLQQAQAGTLTSMKIENNHCDRLVALGLVWQKYTSVLNGGVNVEYGLTEAGLTLAKVL